MILISNNKIGKKIKEFRKKKRYTQRELADLIGKAETTIRQYENGTIEPPLNVLKQISTVLNVSVMSLMDFEESEKQIKEEMSFDRYLNSLGYSIEYEVSKWHYEDEVNELGEVVGRGQIPDDYSVILTKDKASVIYSTSKEFDELQTATRVVIETRFYKKLMEAQNQNKKPSE